MKPSPPFHWHFRAEIEALDVDFTTHVTTVHTLHGVSPDPDRLIEILLWLDPKLRRIDVIGEGVPVLCHRRVGDVWETGQLVPRASLGSRS